MLSQRIQQRNMKPEGQNKKIQDFVYNTGQQIGKGFSSIVYKGTNLTTKAPVAIKVIDLKSIKTEVEAKLLGHEIKALRMLNHENIIQTYDLYQTSNNVYLVSELCNSGDLATHYSKNNPLPDNEIIKLFGGIVSGVQHFASKGIVHRDLKPSNILINNGVPKIIDFGFCEFKLEKEEGKMKYNVGSPLYMSPEAYRNSNYSEKSDVWALGVILYEMIIGKTPFKGIDYDTMVKNVASGEIYKAVENGFFKMLLSRMLSIDVQRRADINQIVGLLSQQATMATTTTNVRRPSKNNFPFKSEIDRTSKQHFSLNKSPVQISQVSPRKVKPIMITENQQNAEKKSISLIQAINTERMSCKKLENHDLLNYLIFLYRVCKITRNQSSKSTFIQRIHHLTLMQLEHVLHYYETSHPLSTPQILKISNFTREALEHSNLATYTNDLYFSHVCASTTNWTSETVSDYIFFWLKLILSQFYQEFCRIDNLDLVETQKFEAYLYCSEYYKLVQATRGKKISELEGLCQLGRLLNQKKIMNREAIEGVNRLVKAIIQTR